MALFSRRSSRPTNPAFTGTPADLLRIGTQAFGGQRPYTRGMAALPTKEVVGYAIAALESAGYPASGTPEWNSLRGRFLNELTAAAERAGDWGFVGAMCLGPDCLGTDCHDPRYLAILDRALNTLRLDGVAAAAVPPFAIARWQSVHGMDGIRPARWPSPRN